MTIWTDENTIQDEMCEESFVAAVNERMRDRVERERTEHRTGGRVFGNDGNIEVYREIHEHHGIRYKLAVLRYWAVTREPNGTFPIRRTQGMNAIGKWVVVESEQGDRAISYELGRFLDLYDLLYHDTNHSGMEDWTLRRQWEYAEARAIEDTDQMQHLREIFDAKVAELRAELETTLASLGGGNAGTN